METSKANPLTIKPREAGSRGFSLGLYWGYIGIIMEKWKLQGLQGYIGFIHSILMFGV